MIVKFARRILFIRFCFFYCFRENIFPSRKKVCKFCTYHPVQNLSFDRTGTSGIPVRIRTYTARGPNTHFDRPQVDQSERAKNTQPYNNRDYYVLRASCHIVFIHSQVFRIKSRTNKSASVNMFHCLK